MQGVVGALASALDADALIARRGFLQRLDPRAKLAALLALIVSGVLTRHLIVLLALLLVGVVLARVSQIPLARLYRQAWLGVLFFTGAIALPALFLVPGTPIWTLPGLHWTLTQQGLRSAAFLVGRAETSATFALLLVLSTPWTHVLKALRGLGVPVVVVALLGMTHRYVFVLLHTALQLFEAQRSRILAPLPGAQRRRMAAAAAGVLLDKSFQLSSEVHLAMVSRGYRGEVALLHDFRLRPRDGAVLLAALAVPVVILWCQR